jgi:hypothetical protein
MRRQSPAAARDSVRLIESRDPMMSIPPSRFGFPTTEKARVVMPVSLASTQAPGMGAWVTYW